MKREGRQHGMVRTFRILPNPLNPSPVTRHVYRFDSPATAGSFTRVSTKPTNHSKFTGKCGQPCKDKTKGYQKTKSNDVVSNHRLLTWRVVDTRPGLSLSGHSATRVLDQLVSDHEYHDDGDDSYDEEDRTVDQTRTVDMINNADYGDEEEHDSWCLI